MHFLINLHKRSTKLVPVFRCSDRCLENLNNLQRQTRKWKNLNLKAVLPIRIYVGKEEKNIHKYYQWLFLDHKIRSDGLIISTSSFICIRTYFSDNKKFFKFIPNNEDNSISS